MYHVALPPQAEGMKILFSLSEFNTVSPPTTGINVSLLIVIVFHLEHQSFFQLKELATNDNN